MASSNVDMQQLRLVLDNVLKPIQHLFIGRERLTEHKLIASGGFGSVSMAHLRTHPESSDFEIVAVKELFPVRNDEERIKLHTGFARELRVWTRVDHPNVLPLRGYFLDTEAAVAKFISPYEARGNLCQYLEHAKPTKTKRLELAIDTASGLLYLHNQKPPICHGYIKPLNVLITAEGQAKLCDFGLAKIIEEHPSGLTTTGFNEAGTVRYISQELVCVPGARRTLRSDVWAWGGVSLEIFTSMLPYGQCSTLQVYGQLYKGVPPAPLETLVVSDRIRHLLRRCWEREPAKRISMFASYTVLTEEKLAEEKLAKEKLAVEKLSLTSVIPISTLSSVFENLPQDIKILERHEADALKALEPYRLEMGMIGPQRGSSRFIMPHAFRSAPIGELVVIENIWATSRAVVRIDELRRMKLWTQLDHTNIISFLGFDLGETGGQLRRFTPWIANGNLWAYMQRRACSHEEKIRLSTDVAQGLAYLHNLNPAIAHGNLKAHTILVNSAGQAILSDFLFFATPREALPSNPYVTIGNLRWSAPELLDEFTILPTADMWAWGCLLIEIFLQSIPFAYLKSNFAVIRQLMAGTPPATREQLSSIPVVLQKHITACWKRNPTQRPGIQDGLDVLTQLPSD